MAPELKKIFSILKIKLSVLNKGRTYVLVLRFLRSILYLYYSKVSTQHRLGLYLQTSSAYIYNVSETIQKKNGGRNCIPTINPNP